MCRVAPAVFLALLELASAARAWQITVTRETLAKKTGIARLMGFGGALEPYNGRFFPGEVYFSCLDVIHNMVIVKKAGPGPLCCPGEDRPFCFMADRDQVFYYEFSGSKTTVERQGTWVNDVKTNAFSDLKPRRHPRAARPPWSTSSARMRCSR